MVMNEINNFSGKRIMLLQGPVGPFFSRLSVDLIKTGAIVFKINMNAGDWIFYPKNAINYREPMENWPYWLEKKLIDLKIQIVLLFGDCRPIHKTAHAVACKLGLEIGVFEEGYIRPDYITIERFGVNANSLMPRTPSFYKSFSINTPERFRVKMPYWHMVWFGFNYFLFGSIGKLYFKNYKHHRRLSLMEGLPWIKSLWRKFYYKIKEKNIQDKLTQSFRQKYFFVPLQVYNDSQVIVHSNLGGIPGFIENTISSFAKNSPSDTILVLKHHPMDRGYCDYTKLIKKISHTFNVVERVIYIHDLHTPTLLDHARGVIVINSTVGLSALSHNTPTKVCGNAMYDILGLTYPKSLDEFWSDCSNYPPDKELYTKYKNSLILKTQINGNFYRPLKVKNSKSGLVWNINNSKK